MSRSRSTATGILAAAGALLLAQGLWIPAKAALAQQLLERAWQDTQQGGEAVRPWPWADTWPVARLVAPELGASWIVLAGGTGRTLAFGPGHLAGSARPGAPGNTVLAGHRDTHFAFLRDLAPGAELQLETRDGRLHRYRVVEHAVVDERDTRPLAWSESPELTLVTCFPFDTPRPGGPLRYVVRSEGFGGVRSVADWVPAGRLSAKVKWDRKLLKTRGFGSFPSP